MVEPRLEVENDRKLMFGGSQNFENLRPTFSAVPRNFVALVEGSEVCDEAEFVASLFWHWEDRNPITGSVGFFPVEGFYHALLTIFANSCHQLGVVHEFPWAWFGKVVECGFYPRKNHFQQNRVSP